MFDNYLRSKDIEVPKEPKYETVRNSSSNSEDFFRNWGGDNMTSSRGKK